MPYHIRHNSDGTAEVFSPSGGHGKTTPEKAKKQMALLNAIEHGYKPKKRK